VDRPLDYMASLCRARIKNGGETNNHIFLNSVRGISKIIRLADLSQSDVRIVCSKSENTERRNRSILPEGFDIETTTDPVKPINFYTSTCFEGQDIYDKNGCSYIVSDGFTDHTKIDISTSLIQICGRIRDTRYKNHITHIFATSRYKDVTLDEFKASIEKELAVAERDVALMSQLSERTKKKWLLNAAKKGDPFLIITDDEVKVDRNMAHLEIVNYKIVNHIYGSLCTMVGEVKQNGIVVTHAYETVAEPVTTPAPNAAKIKFKDAFEEYVLLKQNHPMFDAAAALRMERLMYDKPLVKEAYDKLGVEEVRKLEYKMALIKQAIIVKSKASDDVKIVKLVNAKIQQQNPVPAKKAKEVLQGIYDELGIESKAKATDLAK